MKNKHWIDCVKIIGPFILTVSVTISSIGQLSLTDPLPAANVTDMRYRFPINPGQQGLLAGTMGELRSTHFHAGIDIRTNNVVGLPVRAAKEGYISRVWISAYGYGNALFVKHPNGHTTVYAHLNKFKGALADSVRSYQYRKHTFDTDISFKPGKFPVSEGDTIAFSGNTGGSGGPHLHFEIRDNNNEALNPLEFGFDEIKDASAPIAQKIALKTLDIESRINDRFGRFEFTVYRIGNSYTFSRPILAHGRIGVEILAYDKMDQSGFRCGINHIEMKVDSQTVFLQNIDKINFNEPRGILALMDYKTLKTSGARFNKLYIDDASRPDYHEAKNSGEINVKDKTLPVEILLRDTYGNSSKVSFTVKPARQVKEAVWLDPMIHPLTYSFQENTLTIGVRPCSGDSTIALYRNNDKIIVAPTYEHPNQKVYLIDVRKMMPDSVVSCQGVLAFDNQDVIPSGTDYKYFSDWADVDFPKGALYDTAYLTMSRTDKEGREVFSIGDGTVPLNSSIEIVLKPRSTLAADRSFGVYRLGNGFNYQGGEWKNDRVRFKTQELGDFVILKDTLAPAIRRLVLNAQSARFRIQDNLSGIRYFEATLDGAWMLMNYDYKIGLLELDRRDKTKPLRGNFQLKVVDNAGNERVFHQLLP